MIESPEEIGKKRYKEGEDERFELPLGRVLSECFRILRNDGWLVMTFNNRDTGVWSSMLRAARKAGFHLVRDGITYQSAICDYARTLHQRKDGAIEGDFILSFRKGSSPVGKQSPRGLRDIEAFTVDVVTNALKKGPATFSQIYREVIPALVAHNALDWEAEALDIERVLFDNFILKEVPIEVKTDWPPKKMTIRNWALPESGNKRELA